MLRGKWSARLERNCPLPRFTGVRAFANNLCEKAAYRRHERARRSRTPPTASSAILIQRAEGSGTLDVPPPPPVTGSPPSPPPPVPPFPPADVPPPLLPVLPPLKMGSLTEPPLLEAAGHYCSDHSAHPMSRSFRRFLLPEHLAREGGEARKSSATPEGEIR